MTIKLSIRHLQMIIQVADMESVSEAANRLGVTQSAISHRIREAERLLSTSLFHRKNKNMVPTSAGKRLLITARKMLHDLERTEYDIGKLSKGIEQVVRIGAEAYCSYHWLPAFLQVFEHRHPAVEIEIIADVTLDPLTPLRKGRVDLAIVSCQVPTGAFHAEHLFTDQLLTVLPRSHPLASRRWLEAEDFLNETYVAHHTNPEKGREYEQLFHRYDVLPDKVRRAGTTDAVLALVRAGFGITILPSWTASPYLNNGDLVGVKITDPGIFVNWQAVIRNNERNDSITVQLVEELKSAGIGNL